VPIMPLAMPASRSLIALLIGTVVFFALWMFALKGSSSSTPGSSKGGALGQYQSDVNAARHAVSVSNASNAASGNENATSSGGPAAASAATGSAKSTSTPASTGSSAAKSTPGTKPNPPVTAAKVQRQTAAVTLSTVQAAVTRHKVVALLFYNPAAADDQAVKQELASVPAHRGAVVKLTVPLSEAASFTAVTQQVPLNFSPTLVLISTKDEASEIVGYTDPFEINQRVLDALTGA
jgi:hypothetical protein